MLFVFASHDRLTAARLVSGHLSVARRLRRMTSGNGAYCPLNMSRTAQNECARHRSRRVDAEDDAPGFTLPARSKSAPLGETRTRRYEVRPVNGIAPRWSLLCSTPVASACPNALWNIRNRYFAALP